MLNLSNYTKNQMIMASSFCLILITFICITAETVKPENKIVLKAVDYDTKLTSVIYIQHSDTLALDYLTKKQLDSLNMALNK